MPVHGLLTNSKSMKVLEELPTEILIFLRPSENVCAHSTVAETNSHSEVKQSPKLDCLGENGSVRQPDPGLFCLGEISRAPN